MNRENGATKGRLGPTPEFSWSFSKSRNLQACGRLYYWTTYGFWGGWNADPSDSRWLAYRLKHLVTPALQIGILLHDAARDIAIATKNGEPRPELARNYATILDGCWKYLWTSAVGSFARSSRIPSATGICTPAITAPRATWNGRTVRRGRDSRRGWRTCSPRRVG
jgi:hypothetical protein